MTKEETVKRCQMIIDTFGICDNYVKTCPTCPIKTQCKALPAWGIIPWDIGTIRDYKVKLAEQKINIIKVVETWKEL